MGVFAQISPAILPDIPYGGTWTAHSGTNPNNAMLDYSHVTASFWGGPYLLKACATDFSDPASSGMLYVDDNRGLGAIGFSIDPTPGLILHPDVAICDNFSLYPWIYTNSFFLPVVFNKGGTIYLALPYRFNVGTVPPGVGGLTWPNPIQVSPTGTAIGAPHIDVESQYSSLTPWGMPTCDKVTITWADAGGIQAWSGSINQIAGLYPSIPTNLFSMGVYQTIATTNVPRDPDVAMVERIDAAGNFHDVAIFAFLETSTSPYTVIKYAEWDINTGAVTTSYPLGSYSLMDYGTPRIDAIDDYRYNDPLGPHAYYMIVSATTFGIPGLWAINNLTGGSSVDVLNVNLFLFAITTAYNPTVACGPISCGGSIATGSYGYTIQHYSAGANNDYFAEQIDWNTGVPLPTRITYQVPLNPVTGNTNAIASTCNENGTTGNPQYLFSSWDDGTANIWTKLPQTCPFSYKQEASPVVTSYTREQIANGIYQFKPNKVPAATAGYSQTWEVSPNPARDYILLTAPGDFQYKDACQYNITDITGRELLHSTLIQPTEQINIGKYPAGLYLLHIQQAGKEAKTIKVIKN